MPRTQNWMVTSAKDRPGPSSPRGGESDGIKDHGGIYGAIHEPMEKQQHTKLQVTNSRTLPPFMRRGNVMLALQTANRSNAPETAYRFQLRARPDFGLRPQPSRVPVQICLFYAEYTLCKAGPAPVVPALQHPVTDRVHRNHTESLSHFKAGLFQTRAAEESVFRVRPEVTVTSQKHCEVVIHLAMPPFYPRLDLFDKSGSPTSTGVLLPDVLSLLVRTRALLSPCSVLADFTLSLINYLPLPCQKLDGMTPAITRTAAPFDSVPGRSVSDKMQYIVRLPTSQPRKGARTGLVDINTDVGHEPAKISYHLRGLVRCTENLVPPSQLIVNQDAKSLREQDTY
ncbi:hypothetical protein J6590_051615 [Homalodisca vitripennis]|nr:hypothetical protein J6590_051615 [Homalodisca vitripennis]